MTLPDFMRICESVAISAGFVLCIDHVFMLFITCRPWGWRLVMSAVTVLAGLGFFWRVSSPWR